MPAGRSWPRRIKLHVERGRFSLFPLSNFHPDFSSRELFCSSNRAEAESSAAREISRRTLDDAGREDSLSTFFTRESAQGYNYVGLSDAPLRSPGKARERDAEGQLFALGYRARDACV